MSKSTILKTELQLRVTSICPTCNGKKEIHNPEWTAFQLAQKEYERINKHVVLEKNGVLGNQVWTDLLRDWENLYWKTQGYGYLKSGTTDIIPPWDLKKCPDCLGVGSLVEEKLVSLGELRDLLGISVARQNMEKIKGGR